MIHTAIDIGTNTILMLIGEYSSSGINTLLDIQRVPRLGKGVDANKNISDESIEKAIDILNEYKKISGDYGSKKITAAATSFLRDANNKQEFIAKIKNETGIEIEILSGNDEARWTFWGGIYEQLQIFEQSGVPSGSIPRRGTNYKLKICTIDIGGGSTEITLGDNIPSELNKNVLISHPIEGLSLDAGSVRLNEKFLNNHPPSHAEIKSAENFINEHLNKLEFHFGNNTVLIGVAGTITTLAALKLKLKEFDREKVDGLVLKLDDINIILEELNSKSLDELYKLGNYMEGRADIIIPGTIILKCFMVKFDFDEIKVSSKGLRYGIFLRESTV